MQTTEQKRYTLKVYQKTKSFKETNTFIYDSYRPVKNIHPGCFSVIQKLTFKSKKNLILELKRYYPNTKYVWFYTHINDALKQQSNQNQNFFIIINSINHIDYEREQFKLKKDKKRNGSRKYSKRKYYDDMLTSKKKIVLRDSYYS